MPTQPHKSEIHPGGKKNLDSLMQDFQLTMQHALRSDIVGALETRALQEAGVLPPLSVAEMYDYLLETDAGFINWCFPACAVVLSSESMSPMHAFILDRFRRSLEPEPVVSESDSTETTDVEREGVNRP